MKDVCGETRVAPLAVGAAAAASVLLLEPAAAAASVLLLEAAAAVVKVLLQAVAPAAEVRPQPGAARQSAMQWPSRRRQSKTPRGLRYGSPLLRVSREGCACAPRLPPRLLPPRLLPPRLLPPRLLPPRLLPTGAGLLRQQRRLSTAVLRRATAVAPKQAPVQEPVQVPVGEAGAVSRRRRRRQSLQSHREAAVHLRDALGASSSDLRRSSASAARAGSRRSRFLSR